MQHDAHIDTRIDWLIRSIYKALGIDLDHPYPDLSDWYACGDDLI